MKFFVGQEINIITEITLGIGFLKGHANFYFVSYGPSWKIKGLEVVKFQGKICSTKMVSDFSEINFGLT